MAAQLKFIGQIKTPYETIEECPNNIVPNGPNCQLIINQEYIDGLLGLQPGKKILILYWFENRDRNLAKQISKKDASTGGKLIGTFALRSPHRPNPIGVAILPIESIENNVVTVRGLDCLNGTALLDIKPAIMDEK